MSWKDEFDEIIPDLVTIDSEGVIVEAPLPDLVKERIESFISEKIEAARQEETYLWSLAIMHLDGGTRNRIIKTYESLERQAALTK